MNTALAIFFLPFLILTDWHFVNDQDWRLIVPLKSRRADVERLLGPTKEAYFRHATLQRLLDCAVDDATSGY